MYKKGPKPCKYKFENIEDYPKEYEYVRVYGNQLHCHNEGVVKSFVMIARIRARKYERKEGFGRWSLQHWYYRNPYTRHIVTTIRSKSWRFFYNVRCSSTAYHIPYDLTIYGKVALKKSSPVGWAAHNGARGFILGTPYWTDGLGFVDERAASPYWLRPPEVYFRFHKFFDFLFDNKLWREVPVKKLNLVSELGLYNSVPVIEAVLMDDTSLFFDSRYIDLGVRAGGTRITLYSVLDDYVLTVDNRTHAFGFITATFAVNLTAEELLTVGKLKGTIPCRILE